MSDDWRGWKNGKYDKRYHGVKKHSGQRNRKVTITISLGIVAVLIIGYLGYQNYISPQSIQKEANNVVNNASNTIQQISSQVGQQSNSILQNNTLSSTEPTERVPIAVYDNCQSVIRTDFANTNMNTIGTTCIVPNEPEKQFTFSVPDVLENALHGSAMMFVKTTVYQYGTNDFKIGLHDQLGEKNYTVSLWQLPQ